MKVTSHPAYLCEAIHVLKIFIWIAVALGSFRQIVQNEGIDGGGPVRRIDDV